MQYSKKTYIIKMKTKTEKERKKKEKRKCKSKETKNYIRNDRHTSTKAHYQK